MDPYVKLKIIGIPKDEEMNEPKKSQVVKNNGFNPQFKFPCKFEIHFPG